MNHQSNEELRSQYTSSSTPSPVELQPESSQCKPKAPHQVLFHSNLSSGCSSDPHDPTTEPPTSTFVSNSGDGTRPRRISVETLSDHDREDLDIDEEDSSDEDGYSVELEDSIHNGQTSGSNSSSSSSSRESSRKSSPFRQKLVKFFIPSGESNNSNNGTAASASPSRFRAALERAVATRLENHKKNIPRQNWFVRQIDIILLKLFVLMMKHHRELCIIFLLFASGLASFRSGPMKTRLTPAPKPFFADPGSLRYISDLYKGEYIDLVQRKISLGPAFVFYYAPWDSESLAARSVFLKVAQHFENILPGQIRFYAVNCWWPEGECRKNYKTLSHFPIFVGHVGKTAGIIYSGPIRTELMIKFLSSLIKPLTRLDTEEEIWRFRASHDAIMLGYFNFSDQESAAAYETYLHMALRNFEADPFGQVGYGVFLRADLANKYFLTSSSVISLVLYNEIHTAKWTGSHFDQGIKGPVGQVSNWVIERTRKTPITWAYHIRTGFANRPVALGPMDLATELRKGPVILLITRRYYPSSFSPVYSQVKEVALDYFNCNRSGNVTKLRRTTHKLTAEWISLWNSISKLCLEISQGPITESCLKMRAQLEHWSRTKSSLRRESLANYESVSAHLNFTGLSCSSARHFRFFAVDPTDIPHFVDLGLDGLGFDDEDDPIVLMVDAPNDVITPLTSFNISTIAEFIHWYSTETESGRSANVMNHYWIEKPSSISSSNKRTLPPPTVRPKGFSFIQEITGGGVEGHRTEVPLGVEEEEEVSAPELDHPEVLVKAISSQDLVNLFDTREKVLDNPVFVMFTAKFCGMCGVGLGSFLELSRFLSTNYGSGINVTFAKVDMFKNSLPAELSPVNLPTFVFFPTSNLSDGRVFPADNLISTKTLLNFLLSELDAGTRVKLSLLSPGCSELQAENCVVSLSQKKRLDTAKTKCQNSSKFKESTTNSSVRRENCLVTNKASVSDRIQVILDRIQNRFLSQVELDLGGKELSWKSNEEEIDEEQNLFATPNTVSVELEHLRSMKLTLEVS